MAVWIKRRGFLKAGRAAVKDIPRKQAYIHEIHHDTVLFGLLSRTLTLAVVLSLCLKGCWIAVCESHWVGLKSKSV